ncbi:OsmC family protein [Salisediminibacterium halotolerans]|uniref:Uncharacterized OsmC-related protein n=1 Tax=Salisediminibacterium halotolerans TaxID=517425 RepID=A0A1H9UFC3_9BACI|nr:OsmC family protein [Salisediminibacterium haloalkalitolerans]SES08260.1 Uncharacterized OsmC-related protein [Salisediminibacterium haloalkalitolerans]
MKFTYNHNEGFETDTEFGKMTISGNEQKGYRPYQMMVGSIAVCSASVLKKVLEKKRFTVEDISVEADVERDEQNANKLTKIALHFTVISSDIEDTKLAKAVETAHKHCPMARTVEDAVEITETYELKQA